MYMPHHAIAPVQLQVPVRTLEPTTAMLQPEHSYPQSHIGYGPADTGARRANMPTNRLVGPVGASQASVEAPATTQEGHRASSSARRESQSRREEADQSENDAVISWNDFVHVDTASSADSHQSQDEYIPPTGENYDTNHIRAHVRNGETAHSAKTRARKTQREHRSHRNGREREGHAKAQDYVRDNGMRELSVSEALQVVFREYAHFGRSNAGEGLPSASFVKLMRDCGLVDKELTVTDLDLIFTRCLPGRGKKRLDLDGFNAALYDCSVHRRMKLAKFLSIIASAAPSNSGTQPIGHRFYDDKSTWTGIATRGGPTIIDRHQHALLGIETVWDRKQNVDVRGVKPHLYQSPQKYSHYIPRGLGAGAIASSQADKERTSHSARHSHGADTQVPSPRHVQHMGTERIHGTAYHKVLETV